MYEWVDCILQEEWKVHTVLVSLIYNVYRGGCSYAREHKK